MHPKHPLIPVFVLFVLEPLASLAQGFTAMDKMQTGLDFTNSIREEAGRNIGAYDYFFNGGGVAIGDVNNDGRPDIFLTGNDTDDQLLLNQGNWQFINASKSAGIRSGGWSTGVTMADVNSDGWLDIYVCRSGPDFATTSTANLLYLNQGDGTFKEVAKEYGIAGNDLSTQAVFFDMDNDGDLDLFVLNHAVRNWANTEADWHAFVDRMDPDTYARYCNKLYRNDNNKWTDISRESGIYEIGFGLGVAITDYDLDGFLDIYVANDFFLPDRLWMHQENGTYRDELSSKVSHTTMSSMGADANDLNNDGWPDLMVLDMSPSTHAGHMTMWMDMSMPMAAGPLQVMHNNLFMNRGIGIMSETARMAGVASTDWSWAVLMADLDNDGWKDICITNGYYRETMDMDWRRRMTEGVQAGTLDADAYFKLLQEAPRMPTKNFIFRNEKGWQFSDVSDSWGLTTPDYAQGAAWGDLDADGDLDLVFNRLGEAAAVYRNDNGGNFIRFQSTGEQPRQIELFQSASSQTQYGQWSRGYQSSVEPVFHFGLGNDTTIDSALITWADGSVRKLIGPQANSTITIDRNAGEETVDPQVFEPLFLNQSSRQISPIYYHSENRFDDNTIQPFIPHQTGYEGPALAVADVNGDGREDFYVGGASGFSGALYLQDSTAKFHPFQASGILVNKQAEETAAIFFDADGDGDQDLYIGCGGGNDMQGKESYFQDLLFLNDGTGMFTPTELPEIKVPTSVVVPIDYDNDGDTDLFIGGSSMPGSYPNASGCYLLQNDGGKFSDVTATYAETFSNLGPVGDAVAGHFTGADQLSIIVVGEWTSPKLITFGKKKATVADAGAAYSGLWRSATVIPGEGKDQVLLGNQGWNDMFHPTADAALELYMFAGAKGLSLIPAMQQGSRSWPMLMPMELEDLLPETAGKYTDAHALAHADMDALLSGISWTKKEVFITTSCIAELDDKGNWQFTELPAEAQVSPVFAAVVSDKNEVLLAGNESHTGMMITPQDAGIGLLLTNEKGFWRSHPLAVETGVLIPNDVRAMQRIHLADGKHGILIAKNSSRLNLLVKEL